MTSQIKSMGDKTLNEVLDNPKTGLLAALFAISVKYGMAPACCIYLGFVCWEQNKTIRDEHAMQMKMAKEYSDNALAVISSNTAAISKSSEIQGQLVRILEDRHARN